MPILQLQRSQTPYAIPTCGSAAAVSVNPGIEHRLRVPSVSLSCVFALMIWKGYTALSREKGKESKEEERCWDGGDVCTVLVHFMYFACDYSSSRILFLSPVLMLLLQIFMWDYGLCRCMWLMFPQKQEDIQVWIWRMSGSCYAIAENFFRYII